MAHIIQIQNPFDPLRDLRKHEHAGGITIREWVAMQHPETKEFPIPTICVVNGKPLLRPDWGYRIQSNDIVSFVAVVGDPVTAIIIAVVIVVATIALTLLMPRPITPGQTPQSDPVYSTKGQSNAIRLGEPIEVNYGRNRIFPSYASRPFFTYLNNDQFQHSLFCIGQGEYDVSAVQIGDSSIDSFEEVSYEILSPGQSTTLFRTNVHTASEVGGQSLFGPNEDTYPSDGWVGPFPANLSGTQVDKIEVDLVLPQGLYFANAQGGLSDVSIQFEVERQLIDDSGAVLGPWVTLEADTLTLATVTTQRFTYSQDVPLGRYQVRARRVNDRETGHQYGNEIVWEGLRGYVYGGEPDFGNVTLLAVKVRATDNLNSNTQEQFNVIATRKLPIRQSDGSWSAPTATRSVIWAFVDVFKSTYGGRISDDGFFDWDMLESLDAFYEGRNEHFDWIFRDPITVWDAAKTIARVGRAVPMLVGSLISMRRDGPLTVPVALFGADNMIRGSFSWDVKLWDVEEYDSVSIEYTEPSTGYKQENILITLPGGTSDTPEDVRLPGVQDRDHAYREGLFYLASKRYIRENITFETGMEGFLPSYGDLIAVAHDVPRWGQSGIVLAAEQQSDGRYLVALSEPLDFSQSGTYKILLRARNGDVIGPLDIEAESDPRRALITPESGSIDFMLGGENEPMLFLFGLASEDIKYGKVVKIEPQGGETVKITLVNDAPIIHTFDGETAPPLTTPSLPPVIPDVPVIPDPPDSDTPALRLVQISASGVKNAMIQATWLPAYGANTYRVSYSLDGVRFIMVTKDTRGETSYTFQVPLGLVYVRVTPISIRRTYGADGGYIQGSIQTSLVFLSNPIPWTGLGWKVSWWQVTADAYLVKIYDNSFDPPVLKRQVQTTNLDYDYDYTLALADGNVTRKMKIEVDTMLRNDVTDVIEATNTPRSLLLSNSVPAAPTGAAFTYLGIGSAGPEFHFTWTNPAVADLNEAKVWVSGAAGFNPNILSPEFDGVASSPGYANVPTETVISVPLNSDNTFPDHYWRVAVFDVWDSEILGNITAEATLTIPWLLTGGAWSDAGRWDDTDTWQDS